MTDPAGQACERCGHPFDLHSMIAAGHNPLDGGIILCPVYGCPCYATFSVSGGRKPSSLPQAEIDRLRTAVQTGEM